MADNKEPAQAVHQAEAATAKEKEGSGAVQNVTPGEPKGKESELKEALHELEEEKGDWAKGH